MAGYFDSFPLIGYDLSGNPKKNPQLVRNIFFRLTLRQSIQNNALLFYPYEVKDGETPDIIAAKYYKDPTLHWLVMFANNIVDPYFDWVLSYDSFVNYINNKYGSLANAQTQTYGYSLTIESQDSNTGDITTNTYEIDETTYNNTPGFSEQVFNLVDGTSCTIITTTNVVNCFDYENDLNESKRIINLIDKTYIDQIKQEFDNATKVTS